MNLALLKHKTVIAEAHQSGVKHFLKKEIYFAHIANTFNINKQPLTRGQ